MLFLVVSKLDATLCTLMCAFTRHPTSIEISLGCVTFTQLLSTTSEVITGLIQKKFNPSFYHMMICSEVKVPFFCW